MLNDPDTASPYLHRLDQHQYTSMSDMPTYTFGKNQTRDQASHIKGILQILNKRKLEKELKKQKRLQAYTLGEMRQEEDNKRQYANMLPKEFEAVKAAAIMSEKSMEPSIKLQNEKLRLPFEVYIPYFKNEGDNLFSELKTAIKDHEFLLHGRLNQSFSTVIDKFPIFRNGHKGPEMTITLRKMIEETAASAAGATDAAQ